MFKLLTSAAGLTFLAEFGLTIFFLVFLAVTIRALLRSPRTMDHCAALPLDDEPAPHRNNRPDGVSR